MWRKYENRKMENEDEKYMRRCIQLARNGRCGAPPNPMVGAVIVHQGRIIGEGYHAKCGQAHAEVNAIRSVRRPELLPEATLYVSLEPCAHYGKTPPCADLIVEKGIKRIVIGCQDPFPKVDGRGIEKLRQAGREVVVGVLEAECRELISRFIIFHTRKRPYITLKWAQSADGYIDRRRGENETPVRLSNACTQMLVHKQRAEHTAIMVGTDTARMDNPHLDVRVWAGSQPVRVVVDSKHRLTAGLHLFDGSQPTLTYDTQNLFDILADLYSRGLQSLLVEGGAKLLQSFMDAGLWDEIVVEEAPVCLGDGVEAPVLPKHLAGKREEHFGHPFYTFTNNQSKVSGEAL